MSSRAIRVSAADIRKYRDVAPLDLSDEALGQLIKKHNLDELAISSALQDLWQSIPDAVAVVDWEVIDKTNKKKFSDDKGASRGGAGRGGRNTTSSGRGGGKGISSSGRGSGEKRTGRTEPIRKPVASAPTAVASVETPVAVKEVSALTPSTAAPTAAWGDSKPSGVWGNGTSAITKAKPLSTTPVIAAAPVVVEPEPVVEETSIPEPTPAKEVVAAPVTKPASDLVKVTPQTGNAWGGALTFAQKVEKDKPVPVKFEEKPKATFATNGAPQTSSARDQGGRGGRGRGEGRGRGREGRGGRGAGRGGRGGRFESAKPVVEESQAPAAASVEDKPTAVKATIEAPVATAPTETEAPFVKLGNLETPAEVVEPAATFQFGSFGTSFGTAAGDSATGSAWGGLNNNTSTTLPNSSLNIGTIGSSSEDNVVTASPINELREQSQSWNANNTTNSGNADNKGSSQGQQQPRNQQFQQNQNQQRQFQQQQYYQQQQMGMPPGMGSSLGGMGRTGLDMGAGPYGYGNMYGQQQQYNGMQYAAPVMPTPASGATTATTTTGTATTTNTMTSNPSPTSNGQPQQQQYSQQQAPGMGYNGYYPQQYYNQQYGGYNQQAYYGGYNQQRGMYSQQRGNYGNNDYQNQQQQQGANGNTGSEGSKAGNQNYGHNYGGGMMQGNGNNGNRSATQQSNTQSPGNGFPGGNLGGNRAGQW